MRSTNSTRLLALLVALAAPGVAPAQSTDPTSSFAEHGIEIDGDYLPEPALPDEDWFPLHPPFEDPIRQEDETLCATSPAPKNDLTNSYVANNFDYLYMGMERLANTGNTSFFFSFDITRDGPSFGDFIFVFCFGSGELVTDTYVLEYDPRARAFVRDATPPEVVFAVNEARELAPFGALDRHGRPSSTIEPGKFGEARVRLADIEGFDVCAAADVILEIQTKSSCSLSSQCKDTTGPLAFSFAPLTAELALEQAPGCTPELHATAGAVTPRSTGVTYRWFLDGVEITDLDPTWSTADAILIPLADECGEHVVRVIADDGTCEVEDEATVDVRRAPVAGIASAAVGDCDGVLAYSGAASTDCNGDELSYGWDFDGDGLVDSTAESGTWSYAGCGPRRVSLVVSDGTCESEPATIDVAVNAPPEAGVELLPSPDHCLALAWRATSTDCDLLTPTPGRTESLTSTVDFGDGSPAESGAEGVHRYAVCGRYAVTVTTTDASGCRDSVVRWVRVEVAAEVR